MLEYQMDASPRSSARRARSTCSSSVAGRRSRCPPSSSPMRISPDLPSWPGAILSGRAGSTSTRRLSTPLAARKHSMRLYLLERDVAGHVDELAILRRLEIGGLHTRVIRGAVAETRHERAGEVLHLVEIRHEALAGQLLARALQRLDEHLSVRVTGLGEPTDLFLRRVLGHERLVLDDLRVAGVVERREVCLDQHAVDRRTGQLEDRRIVDDRG